MPISTVREPGGYSVMCLLHRSARLGRITVVPEDEEVPDPDEVAAEASRQRARLVDVLRPEAEGARRAGGDRVLAGSVAPGVCNAVVAEFGPAVVSVPVGGR